MTLRHALALAAVTLFSSAWAQCERAPTTSVVTLPGFIAAYYASFRSDSANDLVDFYGGVCVTAVGGEWTVLADSARVTGLSGALGLVAPNATFIYGAWRISATMLDADENTLKLSHATVTGPSVSGQSASVTLDLKTGIIDLTDLELESAAFVVRGDGAVLRGETLTVSGAVVTTCIDVGTPVYQIEGVSAEVDLTARSVELSGGRLALGELKIPLRETIVLNEETLATFELPVKVQFVSDRTQRRPGAGLGVRMVGIPVDTGLTLDVGATGIDSEHDVGAVVLLNARTELPDPEGGAPTVVTATAGLEAGRPYLDFDLARQLTTALSFGFEVFSGALPARDQRHEGAISLAYRRQLPLGDSRPASQRATASFELRGLAAVTALASAHDPTNPWVAGPRLGVRADAALASGTTPAGTFTLSVRLDAALYPQQRAHQLGARLVPGWRYGSGPFSIAISHDAWFTDSGSPFGVGVDRLLPRQRTEATVRIAGELWRGAPVLRRPSLQLPAVLGAAPTLTGFAQLRAVHELVPEADQPPGFRQLRSTFGLTYRVEPWEFSASLAVEVAGLVDDASGRDSFVQLGVQAARSGWPVLNPASAYPNVPRTSLELGVNTVFGLDTTTVGQTGLRSLETRLAVPLAFRTLEVRPYLAFDFAPTVVDGLLPEWSAHGLDVTFVTCCGSFTLGYLNDRGQWSASMAVDLERRPRKE